MLLVTLLALSLCPLSSCYSYLRTRIVSNHNGRLSNVVAARAVNEKVETGSRASNTDYIKSFFPQSEEDVSSRSSILSELKVNSKNVLSSIKLPEQRDEAWRYVV